MWPATCFTLLELVRDAAITKAPTEINLVGPADALDSAAQPVLKRVVASQTWTFVLAKVDAQGWFLFADSVLAALAQKIVEMFSLWSHTDAAREV